MPRFEVRRSAEVPPPPPARASRAARELQHLYESFIRDIDGNVGELELLTGEQIRGVKVRLRRAATRVGSRIEIWDADGKVYFRVAAAERRRGRPPKSAFDQRLTSSRSRAKAVMRSAG